MSTIPPPLLRRTQLLPGERLESILHRLAILNRYPSTAMFYTLIMKYNVIDRPRRGKDNPISAELLEFLSQLTTISAVDLYAATPHRFFHTLVPPEQAHETIHLSENLCLPIVPVGVLGKQMQRSQSKFCPVCLSGGSYARTIWALRSVSACVEHQSLLLDSCPVCHKAVEVNEMVDRRCRGCAVDLSQVKPVDVRYDEFGLLAQKTIQSWLLEQPLPGSPALSAIPNQPRSVLYRFLYGLATILRADAGYFHRIPGRSSVKIGIDSNWRSNSEISYGLFATAFKGLLNWPEGFFDLIYQYILDVHSPGMRHFRYGALQDTWLKRNWRGQAFQFVQEAFKEFLLSQRNILYHPEALSQYFATTPQKIKTSFYVTQWEAAKALGVGVNTIHRLMNIGRLTKCDVPVFPPSPKAKGITILLQRAEVEKMRENWKSALPLRDAMERLGVSKNVVLDLASEGVLSVERGPLVDDGPNWLFSAQSVNDCIDGVCRLCNAPSLPTQDLLSLADAIRILETVGYNAAKIIKETLEGKISCFVVSNPAKLNELMFEKNVVAQVLNDALKKNRWVRQNEIAKRMGVKETVASKWVSNGLVSMVATFGMTRYFDQDQLDAFVSAYVFSDEAARILQVGSLTVQHWAKKGRLKPVAGPGVDNCHYYLFCRADLERLRPNCRLTTPQMAKRMGITTGQLRTWINKGKVQPISGPGIDQCGHYLFILPEYEKSRHT